VVRAHNRIVRDALHRFQGREIKHTGDGIMASFTSASNSLDAAIVIMEGVRDHNVAEPDLSLHLKIGINAGEPIAEENDLFGTAVQLAARICDKAGTEQILVHETLRGICAGKSYGFVSRGAWDLKGVQDKTTLFEVSWDDSAPVDAPLPPTTAEDKPEAPPEVPPETSQETPRETLPVG